MGLPDVPKADDPAALRFIKACLRTGNHFIHRNFTKNGVTKAIIDLVDRETTRDTMLSSACLDTLELIRKVGYLMRTRADSRRTT